MVTATFRFYEELNDFLARPLRRQSFSCACARDATAKHMIEALGVPHTEVELILVNGESVGFDHPLQEGDRVAVYPTFEALDIRPLLRVRERPLRVLRFIADAHLGGLAQLLRLAGFDTLYDNHYEDARIEALALDEARIVLTRDRELLKRRAVLRGCYVRTLQGAVPPGRPRRHRWPRARRRARAPYALRHLRRVSSRVLGRLALAAHART